MVVKVKDVVGVVLVSCGLSAVGRLASAMSGGPPPPCPTSLPSPLEHQQKDNIKYDLPHSQSPEAPQPPAPRRKLENADSSYDSDFDPCEVTSTPVVATQDQDPTDDEEHEDVCRTVSDTLAAEFAEYVSVIPTGNQNQKGITTHTPNSAAVTTVLPTTPPLNSQQTTKGTAYTAANHPAVSVTQATIPSQAGKPALAHKISLQKAPTICNVSSALPTSTTVGVPPPTLILTEPPKGNGGEVSSTFVVVPPEVQGGSASCAWVCDRPGYASQVEFGVKLGYSEALVQQALAKLGHQPPKDELLAELIRLGSASQRPEGEVDPSDDVADVKDDGEAQQSTQQTSNTQQEAQQQQRLQHPQLQMQHSTLRSIVIDGSNVAMSHGNKSTFSCRGLRICVDWFRARGHTQITVFVPTWRKEAPRWDAPITDRELLLDLESEGYLVFTPSRVCGGKRIVMYDDRYILNEALQSQAIVVSNDNYRDLATENRDYHRIVEENLLMFSWVNGRFVPPDDPLGRNGPTLDVFLRRVPSRERGQANCPYGRKCTYGNKCKYNHPERGNAQIKSVTERLQEQAQRHYQDKAKSRDSSPGEGLRGKSLSLPVGVSEVDITKKPLTRTKSNVPGASSLTIPSGRQLPSALTQESSSSRDKSSTAPSPTAASPHHPQLLHPQLDPRPLTDPLRSSQLYKSESSLYPLYASTSLQGGYGALGWKQPGPGTLSSSSAAPNSGFSNTHLPLGKQLSDPPDSQLMSDNPHPRLQRQLTLNPAFDSRLYKIQGFREPAPELFRFAGQPPQQPMQHATQHHHHQPQQPAPGSGSPNRSMVSRGESDSTLVFQQSGGNVSGGRASPGFSSSPYGSREHLAVGLHPPLTRHSSSQEGTKNMSSLPLHMYPFNSHPQVSRFASAPDPIWGGQQQATPSPPHITRLNSTSDTHLNVYGSCSDSTQFLGDVFEDVCRLPPNFSSGNTAPHHGVAPGSQSATPSPGPIGSRPLSPKQGAQALHHSPIVSPRLPQLQSQHSGSLTSSSSFTNLLSSATSHEDARLRVFYHLSNLFPEAQVRAVLAQYPNETDPQKICSYIVAMNPSGQQVGSRPMSPQQQPPPPTPNAATHQGLAIRGSSPITTGFASSLSSGHEDARLRAFYHLSQLFPEAEVRAVLARYPEETDVRQFCATLLGYGTGPS
ncbi:unnamed protein product, partial [Meganyctiphanes norvegica]